MRTERNFRHTTKAAFAFVFTTATYLLARTTGFLPSWLGGQTEDAVTPQDSHVIPRLDRGIQEYNTQLSASFMDPVVKPRDDVEPAIRTGQRRLLQSSGGITLANPIPDQLIQVGVQYQYSLDNVFSGNYSLIWVEQSNGQPLPSWLSIQYKQLSTVSCGYVQGVAMSSTTAFVACDSLQIVDVSNTSNPRVLSRMAGYAQGVAVNGTTAFVADYYAGLKIVDVSNTSNPRVLSTVANNVGGYAQGVAVSGTTAFVADRGAGLQIVDTSNTSNPRVLSTVANGTGGTAYGVAVSGMMVFVADFGAGLQIVDVSNTSNPRVLSRVDSSVIGFANSVVVSSTTAFVTNGGGLKIVDVSNTSNPRVLSTLATSVSGYAQGVAVSGTTAFVADFSAGLQIMDVSNLSNPRMLGTVSNNAGGLASGVAVSGTTVFVADGSAGLQIVDISQAHLMGVPPSTQTGQSLVLKVNVRDTTGMILSTTFTLTCDQLPQPVVTTLQDQSIFPGGSLSLLLQSQLLFTNPRNVFLRLAVMLTNGQEIPPWLKVQLSQPIVSTLLNSAGGTALDVAVRGTTAFVAGSNGGLQIVDVSNPSDPRVLSTVANSAGGFATGVAVSGTTAFVADSTAGLQIVDVNNPSSPRVLSTVANSAGGEAKGIAVSGTTAFVADYGAGLQIVDVSNLSNPRVLSTVNSAGGYAWAVAVSGTTAFVADDIVGLQIVDVSNTSNPRVLSTVANSPGGQAQGVTVSGTTAFVADYGAGLQIVDVSNLSNPRVLSTLANSAGGKASGVAVSGTTAFVADGGLKVVVDVSNTSAPQVLSTVSDSAGGDARGVAISGTTAFVADYSAGLQIIDLSQWQFVATPTASDVGNYRMQLIAIDDLGGTATTQAFTIRVEGPPQITGVLPTQYARVGQFFNYFTPEGLFVDPNFDAISFTATLVDGSSLPNWLAFNGISAAFAGTPSAVGNLTVLLSATDNIAGSVNATFNIITSHLPVADLPIATQIASIGIPFYFKTPSTAFFDQDGDPLTYAAQRVGGQPLPSWLRFNASVSSFSGLPNGTDGGQYDLQILATDPYNGQASTVFTLLVEHFPVVNQTIPSQTVRVSDVWNFALPPSAFSDADGNPLSYRARRPDGSTLPNWLGFNPQTLLFSGQPAKSDLGVLIVQVSASDPYGASASQNFNVTVLDIPTLGTHMSRQLLNVGATTQFRVPSNAFNYQGSELLRYAAYQQLNQTLPGWLQFNNVSLTFSGTPQSNNTGTYSLSVVAQDNYGHAATNTFDTVVERFPVANQSLAPVVASIGNPMAFTIPSSAFVDPEGDSLTYSTRRADGSALPNWLIFESSSRVFSGVPVVTDIGAMMLQIIVTDPQGGSAQQNMTLTILYAPVVATPPPALQPLREERPFVLTLSSQTFSDPGGAALNYSASLIDGSPLPTWLTFIPQNLTLSGTPALTDVGTLAIQITATNPQGSYVDLPLSLVIWNNFPPQVMQTLSNQQVTVLNAFQFFAPPDTFSDANEDVLHYSAAQVDGQPLPGWLHFDAQRLGFFGTPKRSDTGDFAARVIPVALTAHDDKSATTTQFNISVQGTSNVALFLQVIIPLISALATAYGLHKKRALVLNRYKPERYQRLTEEKLTVGDSYEYPLTIPADQVKKVRVLLPHPRKDCLRLFMSPYRSLPGGLDLPAWLDYDTDTNTLRSNAPIPSTASAHLIVQIRGKDDVILEQFPLHIARAEREAKEAKGLDDVRTQHLAPALPAIDDEPGVEMRSIGGMGYSS